MSLYMKQTAGLSHHYHRVPFTVRRLWGCGVGVNESSLFFSPWLWWWYSSCLYPGLTFVCYICSPTSVSLSLLFFPPFHFPFYCSMVCSILPCLLIWSHYYVLFILISLRSWRWACSYSKTRTFDLFILPDILPTSHTGLTLCCAQALLFSSSVKKSIRSAYTALCMSME